jgi:hypothetical protein
MELVSQVLSGQVPSEPAVHPAAKESLLDLSDRKKTTRLGFLTFWGGIVVAAAIGILGGALSNLDGDLGGFVASLAGFGGLICVIGIGLLIYSRFLPKDQPVILPQQQSWLPPAQPYVNMQPGFERRPASSVTENTTELFDASNK